jgi:chromosome partition protein MukF
MVTTSDSSTDPRRVLASLASQRISLELGNLDLCFAAVLHVRASQAGLTSFSEEQLVDAFELVCDTVEPGADNGG